MRYNARHCITTLAIALVAIAFSPMPALADPGATLTPGNVAGATNCLLGGAAAGPINDVAGLFAFGGVPDIVSAVAATYERLIFGIVVILIIIRVTVRAAADSIDGLVVNAFQTALGPSILFAFGLFLAGTVANAGQNFILFNIINNAEHTLSPVLVAGYNQAGYGAVGPAIDLPAALDQGNLTGLVRSGICVAETVVFGVPTGNTFGANAINFFLNLTATANALLKGPAGIIAQALLTGLQTLAAIYVLWVFTRLMFEVFMVYIIKLFLIPVGLIFFAFGQLEIFGFLKTGYIHMVVSILIRVVMLALFLPLFVGVLIGTSLLATRDMNLAAVGTGDTLQRVVDVFVIVLGAAFLQFFVSHYAEFGEMLIRGGGGPSGERLERSVSAGMAATAGVMGSAVQRGVSTAITLAGGPAALGAMGVAAANRVAGGTLTAGATGEAAAAAAAESVEAVDVPRTPPKTDARMVADEPFDAPKF